MADEEINTNATGGRDPGRAPARRSILPAPDFSNSEELRKYLNAVRMLLRTISMELHVGASEAVAGMTEIPAPPGTMFSKSVRRRRAQRVGRHLHHGAECVLDGAVAPVRMWGAFKREYATELGPRRRRKSQFTVVPQGGGRRES